MKFKFRIYYPYTLFHLIDGMSRWHRSSKASFISAYPTLYLKLKGKLRDYVKIRKKYTISFLEDKFLEERLSNVKRNLEKIKEKTKIWSLVRLAHKEFKSEWLEKKKVLKSYAQLISSMLRQRQRLLTQLLKELFTNVPRECNVYFVYAPTAGGGANITKGITLFVGDLSVSPSHYTEILLHEVVHFINRNAFKRLQRLGLRGESKKEEESEITMVGEAIAHILAPGLLTKALGITTHEKSKFNSQAKAEKQYLDSLKKYIRLLRPLVKKYFAERKKTDYFKEFLPGVASIVKSNRSMFLKTNPSI